MAKKYVAQQGVSMDQPVQSSPFLTPGVHEVEMQALHDDGVRFVLSLKSGENIHIHSVEKEALEDGLEGVLGVFNKYEVEVALTDGVCAVAYGNGYNLISHPDKKLLLDKPLDILKVVEKIQKENMKLATPKIVRITQL